MIVRGLDCFGIESYYRDRKRAVRVIIKIRHPIFQPFCKHDFQRFETPIDRKTNPYGFVALNDDGIFVCIKCGKREMK